MANERSQDKPSEVDASGSSHCSLAHVWWIFSGLECCKVCGKVKRRDGKNKPCTGAVRVGPR